MRKIAVGFLVAAMVAVGWWLALAAPAGPEAAPARPSGETAAETADPGRLEPIDARPAPEAPATRARLDLVGEGRGRGGLLVRVTQAPEGAGLAHVAVRARALDGRTEDVTRRVAVTDAAGLALFDALDAGFWHVKLDRWPEAEVEVLAGAQHEITLSVPPGSSALARVRNADAVLVAGASVTLWGANGLLDIPGRDVGEVVGQTDHKGELLVHGLPNLAGHGSWLAAQHPTFGTSVARMVRAPRDANDREVRVIELQLEPGGAFLDLRVTSDTDAPLAGAEAQLRPVDRPGSKEDAAGRAFADLQRSARTDIGGRAQLGPLTRGDYRLIVRAPGHATVWGTVAADGRPRLSRDVVLAPEARAHGRVLGTDGAPGARITVTVATDAGGVSTESDRDGNFTLGGLAAGPARWLTSHPSIARVEGTCTLVRGESTAIAITLPRSTQLVGRVVDETDRGLAGWRLVAKAAAGGTHDAITEPDGTFTLGVRGDGEWVVRVHEPGVGLPLPIPGLDAVRPGAEPLLIRVSADARASTYVEGTLVDAGDRPAIDGQFLSFAMGDARIHLGRTAPAAETDASNGHFRFGPLPPGTGTLSFAGTTTVEFSVRDIELVPRRTTQLGRIVVPASGIVRAELAAEAGSELGDVRVQLDRLGDVSADSDIFSVDAATLTGAKAFLPGRYRATVYGTGFRWLVQEVEVVAGRTTKIEGTLRPAARFGLRLHRPAGESAVTFVVRDAAGSDVFNTELDPGSAFEDSWPFLDRGVFEVEATGKSGRLYRARFTVDTLERRTIPHDVRVEAR